MASSSLLPFDVVEDILSRASIETLIRCKQTNKQWYALCNNKRFIYNHLDLSKERLLRIYHDKVEIINPVTLDILRLPVPPGFNNVTGRKCVIHCDGLILLCRWSTKKGPWYNNVAVWNPVLGQLKFVESLSHRKTYMYCFGYDTRENYKILRVGYRKFEIYDFKCKLWRSPSGTLDWYVYHKQDVSMNGNMYWINVEDIFNPGTYFILSFDFSKETFKRLCSFPFESNIVDSSVVFSGFGGDRLSLCRVGDKTRELEVLVTNKVTDEVVSWSKYFKVTHPDLPILLRYPIHWHVPTFFIHKTNYIMLWWDKVVGEGYATSFYEICQGEIKRKVETRKPFRDRGEDYPYVSSFVYVPSLVPVPE